MVETFSTRVNDMVALLSKPLLYERAIFDAEKRVTFAHVSVKDAARAELATAQARWDAEASARAARAKAKTLGFCLSKYDPEKWIHLNKVTKCWVKVPVEEVAAAVLGSR